MSQHKQQQQQQQQLPPTKMTPTERAISLVLNILLFLGLVVTLLYGGAIADWMNSLGK